MADTYEKDLAQKTSLTTSDYIRVVGSDNVSYKQLVSAVMTAMGLNAIKNPATNVSNVDTATATGFYAFSSSASGTKPLANSGGDLIVIAHSTTYSVQVAIPYSSINGMAIYKRVILSGTPSDWQKQPTRGEVDALGQKFTVTTSGQTFTISSNYRGILYITDSSTPRCGEYFVISTSAGAVSYKEVSSASDLTITVGTNSLTLTPTSGTRVVMFTTLQGTIS